MGIQIMETTPENGSISRCDFLKELLLKIDFQRQFLSYSAPAIVIVSFLCHQLLLEMRAVCKNHLYTSDLYKGMGHYEKHINTSRMVARVS